MVGKPQPQTKAAEETKREEPEEPPHERDYEREEVRDEGHPNRVRPETSDGEVFEDPSGFTDDYIAEVESELDAYEAGIKAVRAEVRNVKNAKGDKDFAALRHAMHELSHGNPLTRTAHAVVTRRDGPERLREAPAADSNVSSGPGEELNAEQAAERRVVGR